MDTFECEKKHFKFYAFLNLEPVREILSEPPRGADWLALTGGIPIYEY